MRKQKHKTDILVLGAGIAGLASALAIKNTMPEREVLIIDRDTGPASDLQDDAFFSWPRNGATQFRHSHIFISRLFVLLRDHYPLLLTQLFEAGASEFTFQQTLPGKLRSTYIPIKGDEDLSLLSCRRSTLEQVLRRYVEGLSGVTFLNDLICTSLLLKSGTVTGVEVKEQNKVVKTISANLAIDALGRTSPCFDWLQEANLPVREKVHPTGILYFTRHYRLLPGQEPPAPGPYPMAADNGYLKYGIFRGDQGYFSMILCCPEHERSFRKRVLDPDFFDQVISTLPATSAWIDEARAEPISRVFAMGNLISRWRTFMQDGKVAVRGYYAVGDSHLRSNPQYGRGCTFAFLMAEALADSLHRQKDPDHVLRAYEHRLARELRPHYDDMIMQDRLSAKRAKGGGGSTPLFQRRLLQHFMSAGVLQSVRTDIHCFRDAMRSFLMLAPPMDWTRRPRNLAVFTGNALLRPRGGRIINPAIPKRSDLFQTLDLEENP